MYLNPFLVSIFCLVASVSSISQNGIPSKPILTVKLPRIYQTRSFVKGSWTEVVDFRRSPVVNILNLCDDHEEYLCWSHNDGIFEKGYEETNTKDNAIFVMSLVGNGEDSYYCATSWSGFDHECMEKAGSAGECARTLPNKMQQAFMCAQLSRDALDKLARVFHRSIGDYTRPEASSWNWTGGFEDMNDNFAEFSNRTGLLVTFTKPIKGAPNFEELEFKLLEDAYQHFAEVTSSHMMVRTCTHRLAPIIHSIHGLGDPMVFNVNRSLHPVLGELHEVDNCIDNIGLAYSIPLNKHRDGYYVCFGDLPRNLFGRHYGGGLYCWEDKTLNLDLRCNTVTDFMHYQDHSLALFEEHEYAEWYSDCPERLKEAVMTATKAKFATAEDHAKRRTYRALDEL